MDLKKLEQIYSSLAARLSGELPGPETQAFMAPPHRNDRYPQWDGQEPIPSAVLILLFPKNGHLYTVFMQRTVYNGPHSGQISFTGGKTDPGDQSAISTALRECQEETGLDPSAIQIGGLLSPLLVPVTNFLIQPVVGFLSEEPRFTPDPTEVMELIEAPLELLLNPETVKTLEIQIPRGKIPVPCYSLGHHRVWGATAMILSEFLSIVKESLASG